MTHTDEGIAFALALHRANCLKRNVIVFWSIVALCMIVWFVRFSNNLLTELHTIANRPDITVAWNGAQVRDHRPRTLGVLPGQRVPTDEQIANMKLRGPR